MRRIRWGILGTGAITGAVIRAIRASVGGELVAIASRSVEKARSAATTHAIPRAHDGYEKLLADPDVDAIYNPLPNGLHAEWSIRAASAGKHVLCEKPLAPTPTECARMIAAARRRKVVLMEAFMYRFSPQTLRVKELVEGGAIGKLLYVRSTFSFSLFDPRNIRFDPRLGGGVTMDVGCYCVNWSRYLFGREPQEVFGAGEFGKRSRVDEQMIGLLKFRGGGVASFDASFRSPLRWSTEAVGTAGRILVASPWKPDNPSTITLTRGGRDEAILISSDDPYKLQVEHFHDAIRGEAKLALPPSDGLANARVLQALLRSARSNKMVRLRG